MEYYCVFGLEVGVGWVGLGWVGPSFHSVWLQIDMGWVCPNKEYSVLIRVGLISPNQGDGDNPLPSRT